MKAFFLSLGSFLLLDGIWLGFVMKDFNLRQLASIGRVEDGAFQLAYGPAIVAYLLMAASVPLFALPRLGPDSSLGGAALSGALLGLVIYGIYDGTNLAVLRGYPWPFALVDVAWGTALYAGVTALVHRVS